MQSCDFSGSLQICFTVGQNLKSCSLTLEPKCEVKIALKHKFNQVSELKQNQTKKQNTFNLQSFKTNKKNQQSRRRTSTKVKVESGLGVTAEVSGQDFLLPFAVQP